MFVNLFNLEEKENFMELIYKIATCDGEYASEEEELVNNYKIELGLDYIPDTKSVDELIESFSGKDIRIKKILFFELYGMIMADGIIANKENDILENLKVKLSLDENIYSDIVRVANELQKIYDDVYAVIFD